MTDESELDSPILLDDYDFDLPDELIAQRPLKRRDASRLMVVHRDSGTFEHRRFPDILDYIRPNDLLVLNDTRVIPARLTARRKSGGAVEILLLRPLSDGIWESLVRPARRLRTGERVLLARTDGAPTDCTAEVVRMLGDGMAHVRLEDVIVSRLSEFGQVPLPPYIKETIDDPERYQTVYARHSGSAAAPTAGLHFTDELLAQVGARGARVGTVTLHVGLGTFLPVKVDDARRHRMHAEEYRIEPATLAEIERTREVGGRVIAVGTTSCRTLESIADRLGARSTLHGETNLFITPGYAFRVVDAMITNFHLPRSTLLLMVSAFAGRETVLSAYHEAIRHRYRFFSFGDAMLIS